VPERAPNLGFRRLPDTEPKAGETVGVARASATDCYRAWQHVARPEGLV